MRCLRKNQIGQFGSFITDFQIEQILPNLPSNIQTEYTLYVDLEVINSSYRGKQKVDAGPECDSENATENLQIIAPEKL